MKKKYFQALETLEALYFFTQSLEGQALKDILKMRVGYHLLKKQDRASMLKAIQRDVKLLRDHYGAIAPNRRFRSLLAEARREGTKGYVYLPKWYIDDHLFKRYEKVFPRWPHVKLHAYVVLDALTNKNKNQIFELGGAGFRDALTLLKRCREVHKGKADFRSRTDEEQLELLAYLRASVSATFQFLEAYLNGLAYDCFQSHHDELSIRDHDLLAEWDTKSKRQRFVSFETKLYAYPALAAKMEGKSVDMKLSAAARFLATDGRKMRDALTHPSPFVSPRSRVAEKLSLTATVRLPFAEQLFQAAKEYVLTVEKELGQEPKKTVPWVFQAEGEASTSQPPMQAPTQES